MGIAAGIVFGLLVFLPAVFVGGLFVWAARKDGQTLVSIDLSMVERRGLSKPRLNGSRGAPHGRRSGLM